MDKPYVICHMAISIDGKITGDFLANSAQQNLIASYYKIHREYAADAFLCGRTTMESSFLRQSESLEPYDGSPIVKQDHVAKRAEFYAVAIDPHGRLRWQECRISDEDDGYHGAHIIEVLSHDVSDDFLAHLRKIGVSYIFGGESKLDIPLVLQKLKRLFGVEKLLLEGGSIVNASFLASGMIDEISLVILPEIAASCNALPLFESGEKQSWPAAFRLQQVKRLDADGLWLVYQK